MSAAGSTHPTESSWADATCRLGGFADLLGVQVHDAVTGRPGPEAKEPFHRICSHCGQNSGQNFPLTVWSCWTRCCRTTYGGKSGAGPSSTCGHNVRFSGVMLARANVSCCVPTPVSYRRLQTQPANRAGPAWGGNVTFQRGSVRDRAQLGTTAVAPQHPLGPINGVHLIILNTAQQLNWLIIKPAVMF